MDDNGVIIFINENMKRRGLKPNPDVSYGELGKQSAY